MKLDNHVLFLISYALGCFASALILDIPWFVSVLTVVVGWVVYAALVLIREVREERRMNKWLKGVRK